MNLYALLDLSLPGFVMEPKDLLVRGQWRHALTFSPDSSMIWPIRVEGGASDSKDSLVAFISLNEFISPRTLNKYNWICISVWVLRAGYKRGCRHGRILQLALSCAYDACAREEQDLRVQWQSAVQWWVLREKVCWASGSIAVASRSGPSSRAVPCISSKRIQLRDHRRQFPTRTYRGTHPLHWSHRVCPSDPVLARIRPDSTLLANASPSSSPCATRWEIWPGPCRSSRSWASMCSTWSYRRWKWPPIRRMSSWMWSAILDDSTRWLKCSIGRWLPWTILRWTPMDWPGLLHSRPVLVLVSFKNEGLSWVKR